MAYKRVGRRKISCRVTRRTRCRARYFLGFARFREVALVWGQTDSGLWVMMKNEKTLLKLEHAFLVLFIPVSSLFNVMPNVYCSVCSIALLHRLLTNTD